MLNVARIVVRELRASKRASEREKSAREIWDGGWPGGPAPILSDERDEMRLRHHDRRRILVGVGRATHDGNGEEALASLVTDETIGMARVDIVNAVYDVSVGERVLVVFPSGRVELVPERKGSGFDVAVGAVHAVILSLLRLAVNLLAKSVTKLEHSIMGE